MTWSNTFKLKPINPKIERSFHSLYRLVQDKIATIKVKPIEEQHGVNAPTATGIGVGVGVGIGEGVWARAV